MKNKVKYWAVFRLYVGVEKDFQRIYMRPINSFLSEDAANKFCEQLKNKNIDSYPNCYDFYKVIDYEV